MQVARELGMEFLMSPEFWLFAVVGFLAQLCDGALGMGFGVISSTVLASMGVEPKIVSASVNSAKIVTGGAATVSHLMYRNIDRQLLLSLGLGGVIGATIGVLVLTQLPTKWVQTTVSCYLICVGIIILSRYFRKVEHRERAVNPTVIGIAGGVLESIAGVWGPLVTTSLVERGLSPRLVVGSVSVAETIVAIAVSVLLVSHMGFDSLSRNVIGLMAGALIAAPLGARLTRRMPARLLMAGVGIMVITSSVVRLSKLFL